MKKVIKSFALAVAVTSAAILVFVGVLHVYVALAYDRRVSPTAVVGWDIISLLRLWGLSTEGLAFFMFGVPLAVFATTFFYSFCRRGRERAARL